MKQEGMQQLSCARNLEKALLHQPLVPPFLVFTAQDTSAHRVASLAICALMDPVLSHNVDRWSSSITMDKEEECVYMCEIFLINEIVLCTVLIS